MKGTQRTLAWVGAAAFGASLIAQGTAFAATTRQQNTTVASVDVARHERNTVQSCAHRWRTRYHRRHHRYYYVTNRYNTTDAGFPNYYPNIRYFRQNGHIYYRDLDTGQVFLSQW